MPSPPILTQAFRPLFPLAAFFSAIAVAAWILGLSGITALPAFPTLWHAHEMLFGFTVAVIAGFALTAVENWTKRPSTTPLSLGSLTLLWASARALGLFPQPVPQTMAAVLDCLFLPGVALLMSRVLIVAHNRRNYMFIPFLWTLSVINIAYHASLYVGEIGVAQQLLTLTVWLVGFLMVFMGGRVIPFFSANRCQYRPIQWSWLNWSATLTALFAGLLISLGPPNRVTAVVALTAGVAILVRLLLWQTLRVWRHPMLWILHIGYGWLGVAYLLAAAVQLGAIDAVTLPVHALMAGGLGCLGLGMLCRVALGHSGRKIEASPAVTAAFVLIIVSGLARLASYLPFSWAGLSSLSVSAVCWCLAFVLYFVYFASILWVKRPGLAV